MKTVKEPLQKAHFIVDKTWYHVVNSNNEDIRIVLPWPKDDDNFDLDIRPYGVEIRFHSNKEFQSFQKKIMNFRR